MSSKRCYLQVHYEQRLAVAHHRLLRNGWEDYQTTTPSTPLNQELDLQRRFTKMYQELAYREYTSLRNLLGPATS